ncbi:MAG: hypothetical protein EBS53_12710, partial [Bacteroidetes bacterium]|nr:hypothetical protein [Bacteroidota bacterium]
MVWFSKEDGFRAERVGSAILKLSIPNANAGLLSQELNDFTQRLKVFETAAKLLSVNVEFGSPREEIQGHGKPRWTRSLTVQLPSDEVKAKEYVELIKKHFGFDFSDLL